MKEIPLKQWFFEEAKRLGIGERAVVGRMYNLGKYPDMPKRYVNSRVVFVPADYRSTPSEWPKHGEVRLFQFCIQEMERLKLPTPITAYARLKRGWYDGEVTLRRVNRSVVYVKWENQNGSHLT